MECVIGWQRKKEKLIMKTIYKYTLEPFNDVVSLRIPQNSVPLKVEMQHGKPTLWAIVETDNSPVNFKFLICGTGNPMPEYHGNYLNTFFQDSYVWHVFELEP